MIIENPQAKTILVIDDEKSFTDLIKKVLTDRDYDVLTAGNGEEALAVIAKQKPDLILLDINMPKMGGLAFYDRICLPNCQPMFPVLVVTASEHLGELFESLPVEGFITKPIKIDELLIKIKAIFDKSKQSSAGLNQPKPSVMRKALIVDNDEAELQRMSFLFLSAGFMVANARTAADAITRIIDPQLPDIILIKHGLPQEPDYTISYHLKGIPAARHVSVVVFVEDTKQLDSIQEKEIIDSVGEKNLLETKDIEYFMKCCERLLQHKKAGTQP